MVGRFHLSSIGVVAVAVVLARGVSASNPSSPSSALVPLQPSPDDPLQVVIDMIYDLTAERLRPHRYSVGPTWPNTGVAAIFDDFVQIVTWRKQEKAALQYLLDEARMSSDRYREYVFVATMLWASTPHALRDQGALFIRLLRATRCTFDGKFNQLLKICESLTPTALAVTDSDNRTALEVYLTFSYEHHELNIYIAAELVLRTPDDIVIRTRRDSLDYLPAQVWAFIFHEFNQLTLSDPALCPERLVQQHPNRSRLLAEMMITSFRKIPIERSGEEVRNIIRDMYPDLKLSQLLPSLQGHFNYQLNSADKDAIWHLTAMFDRKTTRQDPTKSSIRRQFLDEVPKWFTSQEALCQIILRFARRLLYVLPDSPDDWRSKVFLALLDFHLKHDEVIAYDLAIEFQEDRYPLIRFLTRSLKKSDSPSGLLAEDDVLLGILQQALDVCYKLRNYKPARARTSMLLSLTIRVLIDRDDHEKLLGRLQLSRFTDEQLSSAFIMLSMYTDFPNVLERIIGPNHPILYDRIRHLVPQKCVLEYDDPAGAISLEFRKTMPIRHVDDISQEYELLDRLGDGSFGSVYLARCLRGSSNHEVAIKVMNVNQDDTTREVQFMSQYCQAGLIPGMVQLLDLVQYGSDLYIVMERVRGVTIGCWTIPTQVEKAAQDLIWITFQLLTVLHRLHGLRMVHGDIQHLHNFMIEDLDDDGGPTVVVLDFGYTSQARSRAPWTSIACHSDVHELYPRFVDLLNDVKRRLDIPWYVVAPGPLGQYERALRAWPSRTWTCATLLDDPVFDGVRDRPLPERPAQMYRDFPNMLHHQVLAEISTDLWDGFMDQIYGQWRRDVVHDVTLDLREQNRELGAEIADMNADLKETVGLVKEIAAGMQKENTQRNEAIDARFEQMKNELKDDMIERIKLQLQPLNESVKYNLDVLTQQLRDLVGTQVQKEMKPIKDKMLQHLKKMKEEAFADLKQDLQVQLKNEAKELMADMKEELRSELQKELAETNRAVLAEIKEELKLELRNEAKEARDEMTDESPNPVKEVLNDLLEILDRKKQIWDDVREDPLADVTNDDDSHVMIDIGEESEDGAIMQSQDTIQELKDDVNVELMPDDLRTEEIDIVTADRDEIGDGIVLEIKGNDLTEDNEEVKDDLNDAEEQSESDEMKSDLTSNSEELDVVSKADLEVVSTSQLVNDDHVDMIKPEIEQDVTDIEPSAVTQEIPESASSEDEDTSMEPNVHDDVDGDSSSNETEIKQDENTLMEPNVHGDVDGDSNSVETDAKQGAQEEFILQTVIDDLGPASHDENSDKESEGVERPREDTLLPATPQSYIDGDQEVSESNTESVAIHTDVVQEVEFSGGPSRKSMATAIACGTLSAVIIVILIAYLCYRYFRFRFYKIGVLAYGADTTNIT